MLKSLTSKLGGYFGCYVISESENLCTSRLPVNIGSSHQMTTTNKFVADDLWKHGVFGAKELLIEKKPEVNSQPTLVDKNNENYAVKFLFQEKKDL